MAQLIRMGLALLFAGASGYGVASSGGDDWIAERIRTMSSGTSLTAFSSVASIESSGGADPAGSSPATARIEALADRAARIRIAEVGPSAGRGGAHRISDGLAPAWLTAEAGIRRGTYRTDEDVAKSDSGDTARQRLSRAIQIELKRVGCYPGNVDGNWDAGTQRAMVAFIGRVNASLPTAQPDYILLTLLKGHGGPACTRPGAPAGMTASMNLGGPPAGTRSNANVPAAADPGNRPSLPPLPTATVVRTREIHQPSIATASPRDEATASSRQSTDNLRVRDGWTTAIDGPEVTTPRAKRAAEAAAERARIAAIDQRKRQRAIEARAQLEDERQARAAAADEARIVAEVRRRKELQALAERQQTKRENAEKLTRSESASATRPQDNILRPSSHPIVTGASRFVPEPVAAGAIRRTAAATPARGSAGRTIRPPTYRVGRLPQAAAARPRPWLRTITVTRYAQAPRRGRSVQGIFRYTQHHSP